MVRYEKLLYQIQFYVVREPVLPSIFHCSDTTQRSVFAQRRVDLVNKISRRDHSWHCRNGPVVAFCAKLVLRALEKLEVNQVG